MDITVHPKPLRGRALRTLVNVACALVSVGALVFILPAAFGLERYVISGGSMTGAISRGSVVFEEVVPVADLRIGDVITYQPPADSGVDTLVTHRIASIDGAVLRTKGDANPDVDPWTFELAGTTQPRVVQHLPYLGYAVLALQDRALRIALVGVPAALITLWALRDLLVALRRRPATGGPAVLPADTPAPDAGTAAAVQAARAAKYAAIATRPGGRRVRTGETPVVRRAAG